jgi:hypothetical protein
VIAAPTDRGFGSARSSDAHSLTGIEGHLYVGGGPLRKGRRGGVSPAAHYVIVVASMTGPGITEAKVFATTKTKRDGSFFVQIIPR